MENITINVVAEENQEECQGSSKRRSRDIR